MKLVLAEKPSVAQSIAKVLGAAKREDGYLEGNGYVVSWCVGHLVELAQPEAYDAKYSKWAYADLPIFPMNWQYEVSAGTKKQFGILKKLMAREDVASLVCATDAGREGELIFRLVYHKAGCRKPFERLWISSMEDVAIKEGFENLRSGTEYDALYEAALCRERADWIVGINATRLFSTLYGQTLNVGRVMTPTLAMAVMREAAISAFKPEPFYTVQIGLDGFIASSERYKKKSEAETIDNIDIAGVTLPILGGLPDIRFESCQITESRMYIKAVNPRLQAEVSPGDIVQAGVIISNSEVGLGSVSIQPLIYRLVCSNGMVVNEAAARRNHVGRVTDSEENFSVYSQATLDAEDKAFVMKIQDTVRAAVEEARFAQVVGKMQEAKAAQMDTHDVPAVVKLASKEFHITDSESTGVLQRLIESNDLTLYGLSNAVTRHSQDVESYDRASELESIGYSILTMPPRQWSRINRAAA